MGYVEWRENKKIKKNKTNKQIIHPRSAENTEACVEVNDESKMGDSDWRVSPTTQLKFKKPQTPCLTARTAIGFVFPKSIKGMHALDLFMF
jgi:hypothetical protein